MQNTIVEQVILVNEFDEPQGGMEKMEAHQKGLLHRAFSVFIFNSNNELLLQQRAKDKYHSAGLWTNTCCSHPRLGENNNDAASRRLQEEMGMNCKLTYAFNFIYKANLENGLIENELDHVFFGVSDEVPVINPNEVATYRYTDLETLKKDIHTQPDLYTPWLKICLKQVEEQYLNFL
ncbi:isopentenyl-diphosphate Delta-isomerase [Pedobacter punctiformis]|uniref:Isopentenyl-diphosphate delta-isomerase n=1 Tax=Pedobacter punctiformis TaxID=3004097 RepID=A0ABT4L7M6_9SPHI|nr:isopentenyl-diphosphate Delta-isomerase [Pedobacter sp. HCMS5-2]MCZ4243920.1 isopentenyl-diphosphate Delta-isomerase [Pedobacter sp. HCMS5-2]